MKEGDQLSELHLTEEEMGRFAKAFKDENFRKMLREYAEEISDPENRRKYEDEITLLEQDRGNNVQFIHPTPFKCFRTSVDGKQKCYVNVCANDKIEKPSCKSGELDGKRGLHWSLPHSLHPERQEVDPKGKKILIYDVVFHPDTLHMASTNERFMNLVTTVALEGIQDAFKVTLDKNNIRSMSTKYKGNPQSCVIRKPIPGFQTKEASDSHDPLAFPYPDNTVKKEGPKNSQTHPKVTKQGPTEPHYTLKYRSFIELQDFRSSRDSSHKSRPREIVITVDLPLLKSVAAITLEVKEKSLLLESEDPAYRLELSLAYSVDEDKGLAKFNKQTRQLVVTLPVQPSNEQLQIISDDIQEEAVFVSDNEAEVEGTDLVKEEKLTNFQEINAAKATSQMNEHEPYEESEVVVDQGDGSQHQDENNQNLCEDHKDETKMDEFESLKTDQKGEMIMQKITTCDVKEVEKEQTEETEFKSAQDSTTQIRNSPMRTEEDQPEAPACTEDPAGTTELEIEESNKTDLNLETATKSSERDSTPPVSLREVGQDGSQVLIGDHVTTAGFSFGNSLLFELD